ncbi:fumarylacetoacetate hydrolase family protein [Rhodococcus opacus]|uniref:Fumarylacetoacetate hydrolase family protein n=1 Tax=Rhodococcus opacus TaxID=37919 RepID=A0AAX3YQ51_RHOOP|nr:MULTISPECIES: fumarylacetoacetate hydrolase family protein [Rhodococcus]ELB89930.1 ureidoglycolate lyase [Rhodococcus wratislaviensis IFP 2016]NHU44106.1 fumarylacetoacetate hydrolase family protein [Rhodococcus sp. A14]MCZ4584544.1 fumarylacetoacetate hydrolase family protein [Rhodococcus opacus]MDI9938518.1 fumarylacetoacetate hydrolase family protein [Rhodococcus sp. IEGM 1351]MDJ0417463.1 fumarylacetoacetate hydrolase family protein [Rhodococcus opacus]
MILLTFSTRDNTPRLGVQRDDTVIDVTALARSTGAEVPADLSTLINQGSAGLAALTALVASDQAPQFSLPIADVTVHAPLRPGKIIGVGLNYTEHVAESARTLDTDKDLPQRPVLFSKPGTAVVGPGEPIRHNANLTNQLDWECEVAVVIGRTAKNVSAADALDYVFGYSIINDISARDQRRGGQWFFSKGQDSYAPFGPVIRTADDLTDPHGLDLSLRVNGEVKQKSNSRYMLFKIPELIEDITSGMTLEPGDVIATGSPAGVGASFVPQQFLTPGDVVECTVESIGTLSNPVIDAR